MRRVTPMGIIAVVLAVLGVFLLRPAHSLAATAPSDAVIAELAADNVIVAPASNAVVSLSATRAVSVAHAAYGAAKIGRVYLARVTDKTQKADAAGRLVANAR